MSNYVKTVDFAAKDALGTGNPAKVIKGTEIGTEYDNIATAVATKEDTSNKNTASGYAGLDSGSRLAKSNQHSSTAYVDSAANFTSGLQSAGSNVVTAANLLTSILAADGVGSGIDADLLDGLSSAAFALVSHVHATSDITSGTFADARIAASNVTQHQASLTILESQITDSTVLARVGSTETITGTWSYTARPKTTSQGCFISYASASNTGGTITVSTSDPSGTPADGDLWFKREA